ncbi:type I restriction endonuclease subunit R [Patiriisocius marinistellae]|uniref:Type I restriction endonuclease subunit R n=1 Tax=Patiriisocius marinistellae TaxID=2494560 RepID=A0A5J4FZ68_9FLAO|nr:DEAD/DEAH box helicase family protein [Patiriisocius marinistellae]GEQ87393.1 type I restriction endonuclease subunit R [Patiriisocius marinistellae]
MANLTTENTFETAIVESLIQNGGYVQGNSADYSPELGMFKYEILSFLQETQPKNWSKISGIHGEQVENRIIQRIYKEMDLRGALDVVRNGFTDYGVRFKLAFFKPETGLNPETQELYDKNQLKVIRQVYYTHKNRNSVDIVLSLNGIPLATIELKNHFTGQNTDNAKRQYASSRDNRELLFAFKKRALVHFAVDDEEVFMATKLDGTKTYWLPFNKGYNRGKGNPPNKDGYKTDYLWKKILAKDSWLDIVHRFVHLQTEEIEIDGKTFKKEKMIFPRYHQLDVVRDITKNVKENGVGKNYLVQHSAGSGKSNSIAWLSYRLSSLHNTQDERIFDSVIVVTDRRVLDQQLQNTIYQFEHKTGVVQKIDKDSTQLASALNSGLHIIITTLQKFPFVIEKVEEFSGRKFAVVIDEAHSSQGGEAHKKMKEVLGASETENNEDEEYSAEDFISEQVEKSATARGKQNNISFFAFTATPKYKTLAIFGKKGNDGKPEPFHLYSMRQAIEEGFILDVLQNYTNYELYFQLSKAIEDDPNLNRKKAARAIGNFVNFHPHNLAQKTEIVIEHFRQIVATKIGGRAKAMFVTSSRKLAKRYFEEFNKYIKENEYTNELKILVAFSGKVIDDNYPDGVTEPQLTGYGEKELPKAFNDDEYKILIVADKYQTGFDQPLLHTMYVDKKLSGVKAVQTLSRLNRMTAGKEDTFVLDFVNDRETIFESFQPYYEKTMVAEEPEINHLFDLKLKIDEKQIIQESEVNAFANVYFKPTGKLNSKDQSRLYSFIDPAIDRYKAIDTEDEKDEFKKSLRTWTNLYSFLAQIMPFKEPEFEKFYAYSKLLQTKLPKKELAESLQLSDEIAMEYYRLQKVKEGSIDLVKGEDGELDGLTEAGIKRAKEEKALLSEIIDVLNERFGTEFEEADRLFFEQIEAELIEDEKLQAQAKANKIDTFKYAFEDMFLNKLIERMDQNQDIFDKIIENKSFGNLVKELMLKKVYSKINEKDQS